MNFKEFYKIYLENSNDEAYLNLSENPEENREELQKLVLKKAEEKKYTINVFHATNSIKPFYKFDLSMIGKASGSTDVNAIFVAENEKTSEFYLPFENTLPPDIRKKYSDSINEEEKLKEKAIDNWEKDEDDNKKKYEPRGNELKKYMSEEDWKKYVEAYNFSEKIYRDSISLDPKYWKEERTNAGRIMKLLLKPYNVLKYNSDGSAWIPDFWRKIHGLSREKFGETGGGSLGVGPSIYQVNNFYDGPTGLKDTVYAVFESSLLKLSDPVTYDDNGNVIPLSSRFDSSKDDIRY